MEGADALLQGFYGPFECAVFGGELVDAAGEFAQRVVRVDALSVVGCAAGGGSDDAARGRGGSGDVVGVVGVAGHRVFPWVWSGVRVGGGAVLLDGVDADWAGVGGTATRLASASACAPSASAM